MARGESEVAMWGGKRGTAFFSWDLCAWKARAAGGPELYAAAGRFRRRRCERSQRIKAAGGWPPNTFCLGDELSVDFETIIREGEFEESSEGKNSFILSVEKSYKRRKEHPVT